MSVYSMTGYAAVQSEGSGVASSTPEKHSTAPGTPAARLGIEIRSVNSRFLDLAFRLPDELRHTEPALRELLTAALKRGKIELRASLESQSGAGMAAPSPATLVRLAQLDKDIRSTLPNAAPLSAADVIKLAALDERKPESGSDELLEVARRGLEALLRAREREGTRLALMLLDRTTQLRQLAELAVPLVPKLVEQQRVRFLERWKEATSAAEGMALPEVAQDRAFAEATAFAIRIDVAEEITRLVSHLDEIDRLLAKGGELGKRLDFLIQELHREANTLGSKSTSLELTRISVDMKVLIEQIREQVQNIE
jgi:uncharacterized protein (TIGR00255 family)